MTPGSDQPLPATTTFQQDMTTAGQRKVNLVWEYTQAAISIVVVVAYVTMSMLKIEVSITLSNLLFVIVTFYFARTNHTRIGGTGVTEFQREWGNR